MIKIFSFAFCDTQDQTQVLKHARQMFYHWSIYPSAQIPDLHNQYIRSFQFWKLNISSFLIYVGVLPVFMYDALGDKKGMSDFLKFELQTVVTWNMGTEN